MLMYRPWWLAVYLQEDSVQANAKARAWSLREYPWRDPPLSALSGGTFQALLDSCRSWLLASCICRNS